MQQVSIEQALNIARQHHQAGQLQQAAQIYQQILAANPNVPDALHLLGLLAEQTGQHQAALELIDKAIAINPSAAEYHGNRGVVLRAMEKLEQAKQSFTTAIQLRPEFPDAHFNLGGLLLSQRNANGAIAAFREAIRLRPNFAIAHTSLADALWFDHQREQAIESYRRSLQINPNDAGTLNNLGYALQKLGRPDEAIEAYLAAQKLQPRWPGVMYNLGNTYRDQARLDESLAAFRHAMAIAPADPVPHSNLVYSMLFHFDCDASSIADELNRWNEQHAARFANSIAPHANDRNSNRRLKIAYISPDFRDHPVGRFLLPLFSQHDHQSFEIMCYSDVITPDDVTNRLRASADRWQDIAGQSDEQVANRIREDEIDVLIDLTLHMSGNRLPVFARKPAPVQITWLGYAGSTGLKTMDYRITDPFLEVAGIASLFPERPLQLPQTYWCYQPATELEPGDLPANSSGHITFGCLNSFAKVSSATVAAWGSLLRAVEQSHLIISTHRGSHRQTLLDRLAIDGIDTGRVHFEDFVSLEEYFRLYQKIDIALDPFPYNGGTTTCDALWMGVPVVTLAGKSPMGRAGLSILSNAGLAELVAGSPDEYVTIAANLAGDLERLSDLRRSLRNKMRSSPLMDAPKFARDMESLYRQAFERWCHG